MQFCNEAKSCAYWLVNETLWYETETRPRHLIFSPRRDWGRDLPTFPRDRDETETFGNYVSRHRRRDRDYIPVHNAARLPSLLKRLQRMCPSVIHVVALLINHGDTIQSITQTSMMTSVPQYDEEWFPTCVQLVHLQRYQLYRVWSNLKRQQNHFNWSDSHFLQLQQAIKKFRWKATLQEVFMWENLTWHSVKQTKGYMLLPFSWYSRKFNCDH